MKSAAEDIKSIKQRLDEALNSSGITETFLSDNRKTRRMFEVAFKELDIKQFVKLIKENDDASATSNVSPEQLADAIKSNKNKLFECIKKAATGANKGIRNIIKFVVLGTLDFIKLIVAGIVVIPSVAGFYAAAYTGIIGVLGGFMEMIGGNLPVMASVTAALTKIVGAAFGAFLSGALIIFITFVVFWLIIQIIIFLMWRGAIIMNAIRDLQYSLDNMIDNAIDKAFGKIK